MLRVAALVCLISDISVGLALIFLRPQFQSWFGVALPEPPIHGDLNAIFLIAVGVGFLLPLDKPQRHRGYLWLFGVLVKIAAAVAFVSAHRYHAGPPSFLLFAVSDGLIALLTLIALVFVPRVYEVPAPPLASRRWHLTPLMTDVLAALLVPFALLRVPAAKPPIKRDAGENH